MLLSDILLDFRHWSTVLVMYLDTGVPARFGLLLFGIAVVAKQSISPVQSWHVWSEREKS